MTAKFTRKEVLAAGGGAAVGVTTLGLPLLKAAPAAASTRVRRDVGNLSPTDPILVTYGNGVQAMKALPVTDPRSWTYQAAIHGTTITPAKTAWNTCEHGSDWFWPWHRMYLYYFERIIRRLTGDYDWALPYWNYESASERQLPPAFRVSSSPLYTVNRGPGWNDGTASLPASDVDTSFGFMPTDFRTASSLIEGTPHDDVHIAISGWMRSVPTAAQDPIFFLHHANIDRLWNLWLAQGGGRTDPLSNSAADDSWKSRQFTFFDENKNEVQLSSCDVLRAAQQLDYTYENEPAQVNEYCFKFIFPPWKYLQYLLFKFPIPPITLTQTVTFVRLDFRKVGDRAAGLAKSENNTLLLKLDNIVAARQPGIVWQVYLGAPKRAKLSPDGPFFVGNLAMFGMGIKDENEGKKFMPANVTLLADRAIEAGLHANPSGVLPLAFVPTGPLIKGRPSVPKLRSTVRIGSVSLDVLNQKPNR